MCTFYYFIYYDVYIFYVQLFFTSIINKSAYEHQKRKGKKKGKKRKANNKSKVATVNLRGIEGNPIIDMSGNFPRPTKINRIYHRPNSIILLHLISPNYSLIAHIKIKPDPSLDKQILYSLILPRPIMCSLVSEKQLNSNSEVEKHKEEDQQEEENHLAGFVTSHLYLKPAHKTGTLDQAVVLRRIRHRKRVNKVKSALQTLISSPFASTTTDNNKSSIPQIRWADDAFAAP